MRLAARLSLVALLTVLGAAASGAEPPTPDRILTALGFSETDKQAVMAGEIVAIEVPTVLENQLKGAVAMRVAAPLDRVAALFAGGERLNADATVVEFEALGPSPDADAWRRVALGKDDSAEVKKVFTSRPASVLNLSPEEAAALNTALKQTTADRPRAHGALSDAYRRILAERYQAYLDDGLAGVAPYIRGVNGRASAAAELRADIAAASFSILEWFPAFRQAVLDFPDNQPPGVIDAFFWIRTTVEGRPHYALAHQMMSVEPDYLLVYSRDYYSTHTYNTLQSTFLWVPDGDGLLAVHVNAGTTDEITGLFGGVARTVGKDRMKSDLMTNFMEIRDQLTR